MQYRIFPPIGIARLGASADFFLSPEVPGSGPGDLQTGGALAEVTTYKNSDKKQIRKQGARFHLFESANGIDWLPANLPSMAVVEWTVHLVNKKSAVMRPDDPPTAPQRPIIDPSRATQLIDPGKVTVSGNSQTSASLVGTFKVGATFSANVQLGQLKTDGRGRLIVLGGSGKSEAPPGTPLGGSYYKNPNWYDDVADGPVTASIRMTPTSTPIDAEGGAWVVVAPPDYAPDVNGLVTLYDVIRQVGIDDFGLALPLQPSFDLDVAPIIERATRLQWVHDDATWASPDLVDAHIRTKDTANKVFRQSVMDLILSAESIFQGHTNALGPRFEFRDAQKQILTAWVNGNCDLTAASPGATPTASGLTKASLESAVGQGFCPGIEAGIIVLDNTIYRTPFDFRISHSSVAAGDLTALMAQPWQADFLKCNTRWWPTQRPDIAPQSSGLPKNWVRGATTHQKLVDNANRLGIIAKQTTGKFLEVERDSTL